MALDPRIGTLTINGKTVYYCYPEGYNVVPIKGTLEEIEVVLGLRPAPVKVEPAAPALPAVKFTKSRQLKEYEVTVTVQFPSALQPEPGIITVYALNGKDAISKARKFAAQEMLFNREDGKVTYKSKLKE